ncbi:MAG: hypothetical protein VW127_02405 [Flavobacteriaceae bacterium]|jgi:hypothetical protein
MDKEAFNELIHNFDPMDQTLVSKMTMLIEKYPYFQLPRFFYTKSLKDQNKDNLESALNQLALYTFDRGVLKKNIESDLELPKKSKTISKFKSNKISLKSGEGSLKEEINETDKGNPTTHTKENTNKTGKAKKRLKNESTPKKKIANSHKKISEGHSQKLDFKDLKLSFADWIDFTSKNQMLGANSDQAEKEQPLDDKLPIIDRFIAADPKISPVDKSETVSAKIKEDFYTDELMTETLAKLLFKQKKYNKAISAYKILSLKYPEKNVFFAGQIQKIKNLQQQ